MARIFRTLLIAAVNAIKEFLAFATDNGASEVGDTIKLNDGMATSNYDWSAYPSDTTIVGDYTQTGTIEKVKQIGNDFVYGLQEPEQDNKDVTVSAGKVYYAYTNENEQSVYTPDDPISRGEFILQNITNSGCTIEDTLAYGSSNNKIIVNNISNLNTYNSWSFNTKFVYNGGGGGTYGQQVLGVGSGHGIRLGTLPNNKLFCCLSSADGSWTIAGDGTYLNKTLTVGHTYYLQFGYNGTQYYCKCEETPITQETNPIWTLTSSLKVNTSSNLWLLNYHYSPSVEWFAGPIYLDKTNFVLDGVTITFGSFSNPSTLYDNTFTALDPQPEFTVNEAGLINAYVAGTLTENDGVYSGFSSSNHIETSNIFNFHTNSWAVELDFTTGAVDGSYQQLAHFYNAPRGQANAKFGVFIGISNANKFNVVHSSNGTSWTGSMTGSYTVQSNTHYKFRYSFNGTIYKSEYSLDNGNTWTEDTTYNSSSLVVDTDLYLNLGIYFDSSGDSHYQDPFKGSIDLKETFVNINGVTTSFYDTTSYIIINNNKYIKNDTGNLIQDIISSISIVDNTTIQTVTIISDQTATIETSANITTSNNDNIITEGNYHLFNLTIPTGMVAYIQSNGIAYQPSDMPLFLKANTNLSILLKNNNSVYYRNSWLLSKDFDLHYQQINFSYPSGATVTCKVNNVAQNNLTPYVYLGDIVSWTCDNNGTITTGTYTVTYSSLNGNIQTITIS